MSTPTTTRTAVATVALTALLGLSACGGDSTGSAAGSSTGASPSAAAAAFVDQDVTFATDMTPHHQQAVEMADTILAKAPGPEVRALAERIKAAQEPEIAQLEQLLATFGAKTGSMDDHDMSGSMSGGSGMMSEQDMTALEDATGAEAERRFLEGMLEHHRGAVEMATAEIGAGRYPQALQLAKSIKAAQQGEIDEMQVLLAER